MTSVYEEMHSSVTASLSYKSVPKRYVTQLVALYSQSPGDFSNAISNIFLQLSPLFRKEPAAERGLKVIFASLSEIRQKIDKDDPGLLRLFTSFLKLLLFGCEAREKPQRFASVWLIDKLLNLNLQDLSIPSLVFDKICKIEKELLKDKHSSIRLHASNIAKRLEMTVELMKTLASEPSKEIRKHIVMTTDLDSRVCKAVSKRLKDSEADVRLAACKRLAEYKDMSYYKQVLIMSVVDRSQDVRNAASVILKEFIKDSGLIQIAALFEIQKLEQKRQKDVLKGLKYVCESVATEDQLNDYIIHTIPNIQSLSFEELLLLRLSTEVLKITNENLLYSILPDLDGLYLQHIHSSFPLFYTQSALKISLCVDLGEEFTRAKLMEILKNLCKEFPFFNVKTKKESQEISDLYNKLSSEDFFPVSEQDVFNQIVSCLRFLLKDQETEFCRIIIECINEIRDPITRTEEMGEDVSILEKKQSLCQKLAGLEEEEQALNNEVERLGEFNVGREVLSRLNEVNDEIEGIQEEVNRVEGEILDILQRALVLSSELLRFSKHGVMDAEVIEIVQTLIYPSLKYKERLINVLAIECLGLYCINHTEACKEYLYIFKVILQKNVSGILEFVALKAVLDFYMVFDFEDGENSDFSVSGTLMLNIISKYLESPNAHIKATAAEGICKLLLLERSRRPDLVSKLLLMFFDSSSSDLIKQVLHVFFTHYPLVSYNNALALSEGFILSLSIISGSLNKHFSGLNLSSINVNKIFSFVFMYLNPEYLKVHSKFESSSNLHFFLFYYLCRQSVKFPEMSQGKIYPRMLVQLNFISFSYLEMNLAYKVLQALKREVKDKSCLSVVAKISEGLLKAFDRGDRNVEALEKSLDGQIEKVEELCREYLKGFERISMERKPEQNVDEIVEYSPDEVSEKASFDEDEVRKIQKIYED